MTKVTLPTPLTCSMTVDAAIRLRRTNRNPKSRELTDVRLATLCWAMAGITSEDGRRTAPSTLDLRAVHIYLLRRDGVWCYNEKRHTLRRIVSEDVRRESTLYQFDYVEKAPVTFVCVADMERSKDARPQGVWVDAGAMVENAYLVGTALGLAGCLRASFDHAALQKAMGLPAHREPIILYTVGHA